MKRNGRRDGRPDPIAIERPICVDLFDGIGCRFVGCKLERAHVGAQRLRHGIDQARISLVERLVREHRGDHRPQAGVAIGAAERGDAFEAWDREFEEKVVAGRAAFADHLDGCHQAVEVFVFDRPIAGHAGHRVEKEFERPAIADHALGQRAMAVDVSIDQPRHQRAVRSVDE